ncbi:MAG: UvrD-helicase domain-containing protein [Defluviitaleaceae bacterium]|nr:UvrD-helicase domain-containing protein [Defluviitaleaceae bacterium]
MTYLSQLNPAQKEAVLHTEGPLLVFAGAGSGKTRVLTYRVAHLIEKGIDPYHIIAITFTNKAAAEMRERISTITPVGDQVWVSTFHAACTRILRREITALGYSSGFSIYDTQDSERLMKECIKELKLNDKDYPPRQMASIISAQKNELISPEEYERKYVGYYRESKIAELYELYQKRLRSSNALDFDDIIYQTVELLSMREDIRLKYQNRFKYVMVDEYQDTNHAQYRLVSLLVGYGNICVVGDDDQSIYGWRGADIENILRFERDYPQAKIIKLEENYRSTQTILNAANAVIANNETRAPKALWTQNSPGASIKLYTASTDREEGLFVANTIRDMVGDSTATYSDFVILYRTNAQSRIVEDQLVMQGIPYRLFGGVRFYERMEVKDVLAYLKAINNPADDLAITRVVNVPRRGIGAATITKIATFAAVNGIPFSQALGANIPGVKNKNLQEFAKFMTDCIKFAEDNPITAIMDKVLHETGYYESLNDGTPEGEARKENVDELMAKAREFEKDSDDPSLGRFLEDVALVADIDNYQEGAEAISLMTLHSAKGLEFNAVFLMGLEEYIFPSSRALTEGNITALEEERRLCYVGFTRAKRILYLSHAMRRMRYDGGYSNNPPSRFLKEIPKENIENVNLFGKARTQIGRGFTQESPKAVPKTKLDVGRRFEVNNNKGPLINNDPPDYGVGDKVTLPLLGVGEVVAMEERSGDYEVSVRFDVSGKTRKFIAKYARITKSNPPSHPTALPAAQPHK